MSYFPPPYIIVALDNLDDASAILLAKQLDPNQCRLKIGKELFTAYGPSLIDALMKLNFQIFLDLKFHDIPNTVAKACFTAAKLGVWMLNVHASGGTAMLEAAREAVDKITEHKPLLVAVTLLTSLTSQDLLTLGFHANLEEQVFLLAKLACQSGLDGVVCSPQEVIFLRKHLPPSFCLVTPGIRFSDPEVTRDLNDSVCILTSEEYAQTDDQKRCLTPEAAFLNGSDYLVIGRPITQAPNPAKALAYVISTISTKT